MMFIRELQNWFGKRGSIYVSFPTTKHGAKAARKANKKIQIIAGRLVRQIAQKLPLHWHTLGIICLLLSFISG